MSIMPGIEARAPERTETSSGFFGSPSLAPIDFFDLGERGGDLGLQLGRVGVVLLVVVGADLGGDGEARRHRQPEARHLGQIGALAAEQVAHIGAALGRAAAKAVDPLFARWSCGAYPSIWEKSATWFIVARIRDSSRKRFSRNSLSSALTVTRSKNSSIGLTQRAPAPPSPRRIPPAAAQLPSSVADCVQALRSSAFLLAALQPERRIGRAVVARARPSAPRSRRCSTARR